MNALDVVHISLRYQPGASVLMIEANSHVLAIFR